jgi:hypothetical protein
MSDRLQEQLLGHLLGALDESEQEQLSARLQTDPDVRRELLRIRARLEVLEAGRVDFTPPPGLAERTCRAVALEAGFAAEGNRRPMSPVAPPPSSGDRFRWLDVAVAAGILVAASLLVAPAIQSTRFNAQLLACQANLGQIGGAMIQYSQYHNGYFPTIPAQGRLAVAGIYAPLLLQGGFLTDSRTFLCPSSALAGQPGFRISSFEELQTASLETLDEVLPRIGGSYGYHLGHMRDGVYCGTKNLGRTFFALVADAPGSDPSNGRQSLNHGGRGENVLLECGGVRFVTSSRLLPQGDDIYVNDRGVVAAGLRQGDSVIAAGAARPILILIRH